MFFKNIAMAKNSTNWLPVLKELLCELNGAGQDLQSVSPYKMRGQIAKLNWWIKLDPSDRMKILKHYTGSMKFYQLLKLPPPQPIVVQDDVIIFVQMVAIVDGLRDSVDIEFYCFVMEGPRPPLAGNNSSGA